MRLKRMKIGCMKLAVLDGSRLIYKFWGYYDETAEARYQEEFGRPIADHGFIFTAR